MSAVSFCVLPQRGVFAIAGTDRRSFLQGLVSNDVNKVSANGVIHAALLTSQGKFLHDFFVAEAAERLLLDAEAVRLEDLRTRLGRFRLRAAVTLTVENDWIVAVAFGPGTAAALGLAMKTVHHLAGGGVSYVDPRLPAIGVRLMGMPSDVMETLHEAGCNETAQIAYERLRLELGLPDGSRDIVVERAGLLECGFEELNGVDFGKGCYVGQEVTTRSKYRGLIKKRLVPVMVEGPVPVPGTPLLLDGREAGEMRSATEGIGLALIRLEALAQAQHASRPFHAGTTRLFPRLPGWMVLPLRPGD
ncbi:MAG: glycine cleavage T protein (aminomethyl transferase) [Rhodospirillaceae bacterium]|nr:MAG: glycine cleavage T protein (aminomethyl transferase) [Rhodospirillaceae bacterium]